MSSIFILMKKRSEFLSNLQQSAQRQSWFSSLQEEKERLEATHSQQMANLNLQFDKQMEQMKLEHLQKVRVGCVSTKVS